MSVYRLSLVLEYTDNRDLKGSLDELYNEIINQSNVKEHPNMIGNLLQGSTSIDFQVDRDDSRETC